MKITVKQDEKKIMVYNDNGDLLSKWGKETIEENGGLEKVIERFKKANPKLEVTVE